MAFLIKQALKFRVGMVGECFYCLNWICAPFRGTPGHSLTAIAANILKGSLFAWEMKHHY